ncbi:hypothetical protein ACG873_13165 [Mesorhizobium sp. AaZ16]|uniref:imine reductase family protein n=1 Tax=Mesorhizobium sp. AaZ16 TaxID=3402289 RepID=UPI00374F4041
MISRAPFARHWNATGSFPRATFGLRLLVIHASALIDSEGVRAGAFLKLLGPWMTAMMGELPGYAEKIDSGKHGVNVVSNLGMQAASLDNILTASRDQGVATDLLAPCWNCFANGRAPVSGTRISQAYSN